MRRTSRMVQTLFGRLFKLLGRVCYTLRFEGLEHLTKLEPPVIYVSNHKSWIDHFIIIAASLPRPGLVPIHVLVHDDLWRIAPIRWLTKALGAYPALAGQGLEVSLAPLKAELARGECVGLYPEARCVRQKDVFGEPKTGAAYLAYHTGRQVLPMAITGLEDLTPWQLLFGRRRVTIKFGAPFRITAEAMGGRGAEETIERGRRFIMERIIGLYRSIPG